MYGLDYQLNNSDVDLRGLFIGEVIKNADPKALERIYIRIIGVHDIENKDPDNGIWSHHCAPSKSGSGEIPDVGDYIYCMFLDPSDPMSSVWVGWCRTIK